MSPVSHEAPLPGSPDKARRDAGWKSCRVAIPRGGNSATWGLRPDGWLRPPAAGSSQLREASPLPRCRRNRHNFHIFNGGVYAQRSAPVGETSALSAAGGCLRGVCHRETSPISPNSPGGCTRGGAGRRPGRKIRSLEWRWKERWKRFEPAAHAGTKDSSDAAQRFPTSAASGP